ncbi:NAD-dependent deacylase [Puniceicoccales bacterium CK1056]|uniref:NAD-dependent protein deacylase n=1 Tax=Oceanipulchritudo coccoides TaxID=2706888 RepID=A0A6B2M326_9BACT|nr:Sir2 family NAD-dependent protein deacetylase [Oceanipulchritudo coccoides]NDV62599.1 NAD-dependent deacylase [Oceanipulchritudo coccoides]
MKRCVILSGSGVSEESGIQTFRGSGGLWEGYKLEEVATPEAFERDPELVLRFYNMRRKAVREADPNKAHHAIARLETHFDVMVITQNVDDLHERAGSSKVLHLHGELLRARSSQDPGYRVHLGQKDIFLGDLDPAGNQLRPDVVWFGEEVPAIAEAAGIVEMADILIVIGTSLVVYPAASLIHHAPLDCRRFVIDPCIPGSIPLGGWDCIQKKATEGMNELLKELIPE